MYKNNRNDCIRCGGKMQSIGTERLQLGQAGLLTGTLRNILSGALEVSIYICSDCGKIEFYAADSQKGDDLPQVKCPRCGSRHDFDYPKCANCGYTY